MGEKIDITSDLFTKVAEQLKHETSSIGKAEEIRDYSIPAQKIKKTSLENSEQNKLVNEKKVLSRPRSNNGFNLAIKNLFKSSKSSKPSKSVEYKSAREIIEKIPEKKHLENNMEENRLLEEVLNTKHHLSKARPEITVTSEKVLNIKSEEKEEEKEENKKNKEIAIEKKVEKEIKQKEQLVLKDNPEKSRIELPDIIIEPPRIKPMKFSDVSSNLEMQALKKMISKNKEDKKRELEKEVKFSAKIMSSDLSNSEEELLPSLDSKDFDPNIFRNVFPKNKNLSKQKVKDNTMPQKKVLPKDNLLEEKNSFFNLPKVSVPSIFKFKNEEQENNEVKNSIGPAPFLLEHTNKSREQSHKNISLSNRNNSALLDKKTSNELILKAPPALRITKVNLPEAKETKNIPNEIILEYSKVQEIKNIFFDLGKILNEVQSSIVNSISFDKNEEKKEMEPIINLNNSLKSEIDFLKKDFDFKE